MDIDAVITDLELQVESRYSPYGHYIALRFIDTYPSFDLITENSLMINDDRLASNQIFFNSRILTDYYESVGNRVLIFDGEIPHTIKAQNFLGLYYRFTLSLFFKKGTA